MDYRPDELRPANPDTDLRDTYDAPAATPVRRNDIDLTEDNVSAGYTGDFGAADSYADTAAGDTYATGEDADDDIEQTRAEIEHTRSEMSATIDAIQEKLSPQNLAEQAKDTVREATIGKAGDMVQQVTEGAQDAVQGFGGGIIETIRANPVPAALAGIGLGWLFVSARRSGQQKSPLRGYTPPRAYNAGNRYGYGDTGAQFSYGTRYGTEYGQSSTANGGNEGGSWQDSASNVASQAQQTAGQMASQVTDSAGQVASQVTDTAGQVASQVSGAAGQAVDQVQQTAGQLSSQAQYGVQQAKSGFQQMLDDNPLAVAAGAALLGVAVGLAIPETPQEDALLGEKRDQLVQQASQQVQQTAQQAAQKVQAVAGTAVDAAKQEAQNQNLT